MAVRNTNPNPDEKVITTEGPVRDVATVNTRDTAVNAKPVRRYPRWVVWTIIGGVLLALLIGGLVLAAIKRNMDSDSRDQSGAGVIRSNDNPRFFGGDRQVYVEESESDGLTNRTTTTTYTQTQGVVTKVSDTSVTVAGNGKTQDIILNSDTKYVGDDKPAVNDSVVILGTEDNDKLTATQVRIVNN